MAQVSGLPPRSSNVFAFSKSSCAATLDAKFTVRWCMAQVN